LSGSDPTGRLENKGHAGQSKYSAIVKIFREGGENQERTKKSVEIVKNADSSLGKSGGK